MRGLYVCLKINEFLGDWGGGKIALLLDVRPLRFWIASLLDVRPLRYKT